MKSINPVKANMNLTYSSLGSLFEKSRTNKNSFAIYGVGLPLDLSEVAEQVEHEEYAASPDGVKGMFERVQKVIADRKEMNIPDHMFTRSYVFAQKQDLAEHGFREMFEDIGSEGFSVNFLTIVIV